LQLHFKGLVIETFARLLGASAFLEALRDRIPAVEEKEHRYFEQLLAQGNLESSLNTLSRRTSSASKMNAWERG